MNICTGENFPIYGTSVMAFHNLIDLKVTRSPLILLCNHMVTNKIEKLGGHNL